MIVPQQLTTVNLITDGKRVLCEHCRTEFDLSDSDDPQSVLKHASAHGAKEIIVTDLLDPSLGSSLRMDY